jgi:diaminohydroxyphosphoribosylaminopyrimidine deaminase/5-amino-6-(5-phosphoribosylamino)uracil reductase
MVGAVVVAGHRIVGRGYHRRPGGPHAERIALDAAGARARGATLYLTLEPCCHTRKRTPPCVPQILKSGIRRVVIALRDPNPSVNGRGIRLLQQAGLAVTTGCLQEQAERLNEAYLHWMRTGLPLVVLKAGMTLDGKIATAAGQSQWITGEAARRDAHRLRRRVDAILVGIETIRRDDPALTARSALGSKRLGRQPVRVIVDTRLRMPGDAQVLASQSGPPTIIATTKKAPRRRIAALQARGATVLVLPRDARGRVSLRACLTRLGSMGITSVLLEGGGELNASALRDGLIDRVRLYIAPKLLGGRDAKGVIGGVSPRRLADAVSVRDLRVRRLGADLLIEGRVGENGLF